MATAHRVRMLSTVKLATSWAPLCSGARSAKRRSTGTQAVIICIAVSVVTGSVTFATGLWVCAFVTRFQSGPNGLDIVW